MRVQSAGSKPSIMNPLALQTLAEVGIDADSVDLVVTLCAEEVCPVFPKRVRRIHWPLPDPASEPLFERPIEAFRGVRDELARRIAELELP